MHGNAGGNRKSSFGILWLAGALFAGTWFAPEPAAGSIYALDLGWKVLAFTNRPALGEQADIELRGIGAADPTNLTLYLANKDGDLLALAEGMEATGTYARATLDLATTNLLAEFDGVPTSGSKTFDLSIWDAGRRVLLASAGIEIRHNPLWESLAFTNLPDMETLGLAEYLLRTQSPTGWTDATASFAVNLAWKSLEGPNSLALAERARIELTGVGDAEASGLMAYLSNRQKEGLALGTEFFAGTNPGTAYGLLNLATTNLLAEFDGSPPGAEKRLELTIWDSGRDVLLASGPVSVRHNPLARHFTEGWTNVTEAVAAEVQATADEALQIAYEAIRASTNATDSDARAAAASNAAEIAIMSTGKLDAATASLTYLTDAPETGGPYARQSNGWVAVTAGSGGLSLEELQALFVSASNENYTVENGVGGFQIGFQGTNAFRVLAQTTAVARITSFSAGTSNLTISFESPAASNLLWWTEIVTPETVAALEWSIYTGAVSYSWSAGIGTATVQNVDLTEMRLWRISSDGSAVASNAYARFDVPAYVGDERIATMADLSMASAGSMLYASTMASDNVPIDYSIPVVTNLIDPPTSYLPSWTFDLDTGTVTVHRLRVGSLADTNGNAVSVGDGISAAQAGQIATNVTTAALAASNLAEGTPQALALADGFVTIWSTGLWEQAYTATGAATVRVVKANATNSAALIWHATLSNFPTFFITNNLLGFTATGISTNGGTTTISLRSKPGSTNWTWSVDLP